MPEDLNRTSDNLTRNWDSQASNLDAIEREKAVVEAQQAQAVETESSQEQINKLKAKVERLESYRQQTLGLMQHLLDVIDTEKTADTVVEAAPTASTDNTAIINAENVTVPEDQTEGFKPNYDSQGVWQPTIEAVVDANSGYREDSYSR